MVVAQSVDAHLRPVARGAGVADGGHASARVIRSLPRTIPMVVAAASIDVIGCGLVTPVLPSLIAHLGRLDLPAATRVGGWVVATFALAQFVAGPVRGNLSDHLDRRPVPIARMTCFAVDDAVQAAAPALARLFVGRAIAGIAGAVHGRPVPSWRMPMVDARRQGASQGGIGAMESVATVIGPLLATRSLARNASDNLDGAAFAVAAVLVIALAVRPPIAKEHA